MPNKIPVTFHLTRDQHASLKGLSERTGLSVAEMIRRAVDAYLDAQRRKDERKERR